MDNIDISRFILPVIILSFCSCLLILLMILKKKVVKKHGLSDVLVRKVRTPIVIFIVLTGLYVIFEISKHRWEFYPVVKHIYAILATICFGWLAIKVINLISSFLLNHFDLKKENNYRARQVHTQVNVLRRLAVSLVAIFVMIGIFMTFESVRSQWMSLLASAGVLSIIIGLAAQKTMGSLFGGIQIAISQPIRVDDVVVIENEWGRVEEIHLTYVVLKLWDLRRLVVPITYFTEKAFQNWTQKTSDILGTVLLYVDYTMSVAEIRAELNKWLEGNNLWDGKVKAVQVTNATEHTMEIRILISARDSSACFDLRCKIREHLISFIQKNYPQALPRVRREILDQPRIEDLAQMHNALKGSLE